MIGYICVIYFWFCILAHWHIFLLFCQFHIVMITPDICLEIMEFDLFNFVLLSTVLCILGSSHFHKKFRIKFWYLQNQLARILISTALFYKSSWEDIIWFLKASPKISVKNKDVKRKHWKSWVFQSMNIDYPSIYLDILWLS